MTPALNVAVADRLQKSGMCWIGTTVWKGLTALRISVSNYSTSENDVSMSIDSLKTAIDEEVKINHLNVHVEAEKLRLTRLIQPTQKTRG